MKDLNKNIKGGAYKTGVWVKRVTPHENNSENGFLTKGKSYQVFSPDYYSQNKNLYSRSGKIDPKVNYFLAKDCVMVRDDKGKIGLFGAKNFKITSKV